MMPSGGKICNNFQAGNCTYGNRCKFVHPGQQTQAGQGGGGGGFQGGGGYKGGQGGGGFQGGGGGFKGGQGGGNPNFQGGGGGFNQGGGNYQGGGGNYQGGGGPRGGPGNRRGPRPANNQLCNFFLQGSCNKGDGCQNIHQFSLDFDVMGEKFADLKELYGTKNINLLAMDIYEANLNPLQIAILLCTTSQLTLVVLPGNQKADIPKPEGELTCLHYEQSNKLVFVAYKSTKNGKAGVKIYKDASGTGNFQEVATGTDLHDGQIMSIQTLNIMNNIVVITGAQDDRLKAWVIDQSGKFEVVALGIATKPIFTLTCAGESVVAGCKDGRVEVFRFSPNTKEFIREKDFIVHNDPEAIVTKVINADDALYATTYGPGPNGTSGQVGFFTASQSGKVSHLVNTPLENGGATVIEYMPGADVMFIGYANGVLEFREKDGFAEKGKAGVHKAPIRSIRQFNDMFIVADESGLFTAWKILDEKTADANRTEYMSKRGGGGGQQQQQFGGGGNMNMGGGGGFGMGGGGFNNNAGMGMGGGMGGF